MFRKSVALLLVLFSIGICTSQRSSRLLSADEGLSADKAPAKADEVKSGKASSPSAEGKTDPPAKDKDSEKPDQEGSDADRSVAKFMQQKLSLSNRILKGLMIDDLAMVEQNADKLLKMSHEERWRASNDMMYLQHSTQFRNAVDDLRKKAAKGTVDGASLAWINVTMSCIQCHQWVRNVVIADTKLLDSKGTNYALR